MKSGNKDKAEGKMHQVKGSVKEATGKVVNNSELEGKGKIEKSKGKVQEEVGRAKKVLNK